MIFFQIIKLCLWELCGMFCDLEHAQVPFQSHHN
eukprot:UN12738